MIAIELKIQNNSCKYVTYAEDVLADRCKLLLAEERRAALREPEGSNILPTVHFTIWNDALTP
eukprot:scaffold426000_cov19-Prasinocladus_malaysianus.AAC.1